MKYRQKSAHAPIWFEISHFAERGAMSLPFRRSNCKGLIIDITSSSAPAVANPVDELMIENAAPTYEVLCEPDYNELKQRIAKSGLSAPNVVLINTKTHPEKREIFQEEIDDQKYFLRSLRIALKYLRDGGDIIIKLKTLGTRFSGSVLVLLSTIFQDVIIARPVTTPPWTQTRYVYLKGYRAPSQNQNGNALFVMGLINMLSTEYDKNKDPTKSLHYAIPPLFFLNQKFAQFLTTVNEKLAEQELAAYVNIIKQAQYNHKANEEFKPSEAERTWPSAYKKALLSKWGRMETNLNGLLKFKELFCEGQYDTFIAWVQDVLTNGNDEISELTTLQFNSLGLIHLYQDLEHYVSQDESHQSHLLSHPQYHQWGWSVLDTVANLKLLPTFFQGDAEGERQQFVVPTILHGDQLVDLSQNTQTPVGTEPPVLPPDISLNDALKALVRFDLVKSETSQVVADIVFTGPASTETKEAKEPEDELLKEFDELMPTDDMFEQGVMFD